MGLLQRIDTQLGLFQLVSDRAEVSYDEVGGFTLEQHMRQAVARCLFCRRSEACRQWLNTDTAGLYPDFCPNAAFFARYGQAATGRPDPIAA